jgi:PAS domain S-box-containing protein
MWQKYLRSKYHKMKVRDSSIQRKLLRIVLITSAVVLFVTCATFFAYEFFTYRDAAKEELSTLGKIIAANSTAALAFKSPNDAEEILQTLKANTHIVAAVLYDVNGNLFASYSPHLTDKSLPAHPGKDGYHYVDAYLQGFEPVAEQGNRVGTLYLQSDMKAIYRRFKLYTLVTLMLILIVICVAYFLSKRLQKTISEPILTLAKIARKVSIKKDYSIRARKFYDDELGELTDAFNQMLTQIERQNLEITSFTHSLEHKVHERTNELAVANGELKLKNEFVETIIDSSIDVIAVFDTNLNYVIFNKYAQKIYGVDSEAVTGKNILDIFPKLKDSQTYLELKRSLLGETIYNPRYRSLISGKILEIFYIPLLDKDGTIYSVLLIGHDITEKVQATEKLTTLNSELEKSNLSLEQFAYVASHDLQEPLRKIQTYSSMLESQIDDTVAVKNLTTKIISSVLRMRDLIKSILNYSQASNTHARFTEINLNEVIENIKIDFELIIKEKHAQITASRFPLIRGDLLQLTQLFMNLVSNSLKFSRSQPEIFIYSSLAEETDLVDVPALNNQLKYLIIIFKDNGIGFEQQFAEKVFTIFQRLNNTKDYPGTGIGLALCKRIVENHQGHISVTSEPGHGTTFKIYLPINI